MTRMDRIRKEQIRWAVKVGQFGDDVREENWRWSGHGRVEEGW